MHSKSGDNSNKPSKSKASDFNSIFQLLCAYSSFSCGLQSPCNTEHSAILFSGKSFVLVCGFNKKSVVYFSTGIHSVASGKLLLFTYLSSHSSCSQSTCKTLSFAR